LQQKSCCQYRKYTLARAFDSNSRGCGAAVETFGPFIRTYTGIFSLNVIKLYAKNGENARGKTRFASNDPEKRRLIRRS
jgi:hypothetical protein